MSRMVDHWADELVHAGWDLALEAIHRQAFLTLLPDGRLWIRDPERPTVVHVSREEGREVRARVRAMKAWLAGGGDNWKGPHPDMPKALGFLCGRFVAPEKTKVVRTPRTKSGRPCYECCSRADAMRREQG